MSPKSLWRAVLCGLIAVAVQAGDWKHAIQACNDAAGKVSEDKAQSGEPGPTYLLTDFSSLNQWAVTKLDHRYPWEDCVIKLTSIDFLAPTFANIAPGSSFGPGLRSQFQFNHGQFESTLVARSYYSLKNFYLFEGRYDMHFPISTTHGEKATVSTYARRMDLHRQDFYGLGPNTSQSGHAEYRQQQDQIGAVAYFPLLSWLAAGGAAQWIAPAVHGISESSVPSVDALYPPSQIPGFFHQPSFFNPQLLLRLHTPFNTNQTWRNTDLRLTYDYFDDLGAGVNTFRRLQAFAVQSLEIRKNIPRHSLPTRTAFQNVLCQGIVGDQCRLGTLVIDGLVTASYVGSGRSVPFYFQPTLGGSDIDGLDTLRGLVDYRLRAPNRVLLQADLYHDIWGPFGILAFYDTGRVALTPSDLSLSHLRHDYGVGAYIRAGGNIVLRAFIAFGAGEGSHPNVKFFNAF